MNDPDEPIDEPTEVMFESDIDELERRVQAAVEIDISATMRLLHDPDACICTDVDGKPLNQCNECPR